MSTAHSLPPKFRGSQLADEFSRIMKEIRWPSDNFKPHYDLLWRATNPDPQAYTPGLKQIAELQKLLTLDLASLARRGSPDDFVDIYISIEQELKRFQEFCTCPALFSHVVVAFGGAFSSGKSSLINTLLGQRILPVEIDTTTAVPTYLFHDEQEQFRALNLHGHLISLNADEFGSLKHNNEDPYGQRIARLLRAAILSRADFPWNNLAFVDTPGYSKAEDRLRSARTDENVARSQLDAAQAIIWVVSAEAGGINETDIQFLSSLNNKPPCLIVVSRADKKTPQDIQSIVSEIKKTLAKRDIPFIDVIPVSVRDQQNYPLSPILAQLDTWNKTESKISFARNINKQFMRYENFIKTKKNHAREKIKKLSLISALTDASDSKQMRVATELKESTQTELDSLEVQNQDLTELREKFFTETKAAAHALGVYIPNTEEDSEPFSTIEETLNEIDSIIEYFGSFGSLSLLESSKNFSNFVEHLK